MKKMKVVTVVGTRPEVIRLSRVIAALDKNFNHTLIHTGQNHDYELNEVFFKELKIKKPKFFLEANNKSPLAAIGDILTKIDRILDRIKPDAFLVLGDTNSCLSAIAAKRKKIPIFHMEAGNRCFDQRVPEETNRKIVDHIADINLTYSSISREYLLREGLNPDQIIKTGSPMNEVISYHIEDINKSNILKKLNIQKEKYYLVSCHREENVDDIDNLSDLVESMNTIVKTSKLPIVISMHPRTRKNIKKIKLKLHPKIKISKPFGFLDYINLQINSKAVLSDSGTITEESSILNFPALNIREAHERPEGMEEGSVMMTGLNSERILQGLEILKKQSTGENRLLNIVRDYTSNNVSDKVVRIIISYVDYINKNVWKK
ncbi:MAG: UDP-N-acetylglucosamine 2-epimerase (non-hydrolyzing) [Gammaproteobacteria bacterium]|nr:UDP-N-acetylglucosamine 2-epimerase (non-hydrolyzing) [Gammaproteobacteria bacterium]